MIEFVVDVVSREENRLRASGAVNSGTIRIGDEFDRIDDRYSKSTNDATVTKLVVDEIFTYGHFVQELPEGMTGELFLIIDEGYTLPFDNSVLRGKS